jgi:hypothetical protein
MSDPKIIKILDEMCEVLRALASHDEKDKKTQIKILEIQKSLLIPQKQKRKSGPTGKVLGKYTVVRGLINSNPGLTITEIVEKIPALHPRTAQRIVTMLLGSGDIKRDKVKNSVVFAYWPMTK